jgi:hypothetical protein
MTPMRRSNASRSSSRCHLAWRCKASYSSDSRRMRRLASSEYSAIWSISEAS